MAMKQVASARDFSYLQVLGVIDSEGQSGVSLQIISLAYETPSRQCRVVHLGNRI